MCQAACKGKRECLTSCKEKLRQVKSVGCVAIKVRDARCSYAPKQNIIE